MTATAEKTLDELLDWAVRDENTGDVQDSIRVICARAELAVRGIPAGSADFAHLLGTRERAALRAETLNPETAISGGAKDDDPDHILIPPAAPGR